MRLKAKLECRGLLRNSSYAARACSRISGGSAEERLRKAALMCDFKACPDRAAQCGRRDNLQAPPPPCALALRMAAARTAHPSDDRTRSLPVATKLTLPARPPAACEPLRWR